MRLTKPIIRFYKAVFSPDTGILKGFYGVKGTCVMYPSCSEYMVQSIEKHGLFRGIMKGILRIGRCHPFQKKLIDLP